MRIETQATGDGDHDLTQTMGEKNLRFRMPWRVVPTFALTIFIAAAGCCKSFDTETARRNDAARQWLHFWKFSYDWVETSDWKAVMDSKMSQVEVLLRDISSMQLTEAQAADLLGGSIRPKSADGALYLLRGVGPVPPNLPLEVFVRANGDVWVGGGANSRCPVPMQRRPVVAALDQSPHDVYVTK